MTYSRLDGFQVWTLLWIVLIASQVIRSKALLLVADISLKGRIIRGYVLCKKGFRLEACDISINGVLCLRGRQSIDTRAVLQGVSASSE